MGKTLRRLEITAPEELYLNMVTELALRLPYGWEEQSLPTGETVFRIHGEDDTELRGLANWVLGFTGVESRLDEVEEADWQEAWKEFFTPVAAGRSFVVIPPWLMDEDHGDKIRIVIDPNCAFGTGHHATTVLCLEALDKVGPLNGDFLDLGCGSGVLGIAAAKLGMKGLAIDIDQLAVDNARANASLNGEAMEVRKGSVELAEGKKFGLVMANILAAPLIEMAPAIHRALAPGGTLILSGILAIQADKVESAFMACGLPRAERLVRDEWVALYWRGHLINV